MAGTSRGLQGAPPPPPRRESTADPSPVLHLQYYHPHLKGLSDVREIMAPFVLQDGTFLLRKSNKRTDTFTVSVMHDKSIKHFYIFIKDDSYYLQDKYFSTVDKLINHYRHEDVPNMERIKHIRLMHPIKNPNAELNEATDCSSGLLGTAEGVTNSEEQNPYTGFVAPSREESRRKKMERKSKKTSRFFVGLPGDKEKEKGSDKPQDPGSYCRLKKENNSGEHVTGHVTNGQGSACSEEITGVGGTQIGRSSSERLVHRPRAQLPPKKQGSDSSDTYNSSKGLYYSSVQEARSKLPALMDMLKVEERPRCDCGLYFDEAELPRGWTMHISHDPGSDGRVFFMGPEKQTTWNLPLEVACELSLEQQDRIRILLDKFQKDHMRAIAPQARAPNNANPPMESEHFARLVENAPDRGGSNTDTSASSSGSNLRGSNGRIPSALEGEGAMSNQYDTNSGAGDDVFT